MMVHLVEITCWGLGKGDRDRLIEVPASIKVCLTVFKGNYFRDFGSDRLIEVRLIEYRFKWIRMTP